MPRPLTDTESGPEARFWALLDRIGLPFRQGKAALLATHGTVPSGWTDHYRLCHLPAAPLMPGLSPFGFHWHEGDDPTPPPESLTAHLRIKGQGARQNFAAALAAFAPLLGPGQDSSVSNTLARRWQFGRARLEATVFPPDLNRDLGQNKRHQLDPGSASECRLDLTPGWLPALNGDQLGWLRGYQRIGTALPVQVRRFGTLAGWHLWSALDGPAPPPGYGPSGDGQAFLAIAGDEVFAVPKDHIRGIEHLTLYPARGAGSLELALFHAPPGIAKPHRLVLARAPYAPDALTGKAQALAAAFGLPLTERAYPDE